MLQFLKFWWDCLLYGWKIGYGIVFNSIEGTCVLILALLLWRRKAHAKAKQWEEPVMKLAGLLLVAAFVMSSVLVAPVVKTIELEATREAATRDVASWSNRYLLLQEKNERRGSPSSVLDSNLLTRVERSASRIDEAARRQERFVVEAAKGNDELLKQIAAKPISSPIIDLTPGRIDLEGVDAVGAVLEETETKRAAKEALTRKQNAPRDAVTLSATAPLVDYYVKTFEDALRDLAKSHGDLVLSTYTNAVDLALRGEGKDVEGVRLEKNKPWSFDICFRKVDGNGNYNWHIRGAAEFMCFFKGDGYSYSITGTDIAGQGKIASLGRTNLLPALTWLIAIQKKYFPLTNAMATSN